MTINRGPEPTPFSAAWWARHPEAADRMYDTAMPASPDFTFEEMERLMAVKPTVYLDEADTIDPTWRIPEPKPEKPAAYGPSVSQWWRWMMGLPPE